MRMQIDEGVYIDFYNLHADAGYDSPLRKLCRDILLSGLIFSC